MLEKILRNQASWSESRVSMDVNAISLMTKTHILTRQKCEPEKCNYKPEKLCVFTL